MGKMWWIPCSDWLPERVRRAHLVRSRSLALIPRRKTIALNGLTRLAIFSQCRRWSRKKAKNIKTTLNNSYGFIVFETNESFLILITSKSFCFLINPLVTKLFRSRWLDITLVFFFFFLRCQCLAILISCMCTASLDQCCCLSNCAPSPSLPWPNNSQLITM